MPVDIDKTVENLRLLDDAYKLTGWTGGTAKLVADALEAIEDLQRRLHRFYHQSRED